MDSFTPTSGSLTDLSVTAASRLIATRKLSPIDLVEAFLDRIAAVDGDVKSYLLVTAEQARAAARTADADIRAGRWRGPLHGIPYGVKDNYDTAGIRTCGASRVMLDRVPDHDATVIVKLRAAGAILLGKLNTWEYGTGNGGVYFDLPFEPARNPWHLGHFTGGSSTGAGASVAAGTAMFAMGSDTGGSVRLPAAACGLQGIKPSYGLVSRFGIIPNCYSLDAAGPLCWTVEDAATVLEVVAGHDPNDPASAKPPATPYVRSIGGGVSGLVIGVIRDVGIEGATIDAANADGIADVIRVLESQGAKIVDVALPAPFADYRRVTSVINWAESLSIHEKDFVERGAEMGRALREKMMSGFTLRAVDYMAALRHRRALAAGVDTLMNTVDALVLPGALHTAPDFSDPAAVSNFTGHSTTAAFNVSGHPAMSICTGFDANGLPANAQIVGRWWDEAMVFRVAHAYEAATPWRARKAPVTGAVQ
jgi:aspartyl-tRNA(Asn)/glutamyl-tRNA(Gln) amidotransferase subunit A